MPGYFAWILRSFKSRSKTVMLQLWKSIVIPRLDYCSQLWNPSKIYLIRQLEELQKNYIWRIHGFGNINYHTALRKLKLYSLQRRRERYQIIYLWSIVELHVPNISNGINEDLIKVQSTIQSRRGRTIATKVLRNTRFANLRYNSLPFAGTRLFNALPKSLSNITNCSKMVFKSKLDSILIKLPTTRWCLPQIIQIRPLQTLWPTSYLAGTKSVWASATNKIGTKSRNK